MSTYVLQDFFKQNYLVQGYTALVCYKMHLKTVSESSSERQVDPPTDELAAELGENGIPAQSSDIKIEYLTKARHHFANALQMNEDAPIFSFLKPQLKVLTHFISTD